MRNSTQKHTNLKSLIEIKLFELRRFLIPELAFISIMNNKNENQRYRYFENYFRSKLPEELRLHRKYYSSNSRGFGENAFHAMWWKIFEAFEINHALEIGVYRGQTISLWSLIARLRNEEVSIWGISPLTAQGDEVSSYLDLNYEQDIKDNFKYFNLEEPKLFIGVSQEDKSQNFILSQIWDLIYIDGSHNYSEVLQDVHLSKKALRNGGILVLDDASLYSDYKPSTKSFAGHPGPSLVAKELLKDPDFSEIGSCGHNRIFVKIS